MANSQENSVSYRRLGLGDISDIVSLENAVWPLGLRASEQVIRQRLLWQHVMLGAFRSNELLGMACWRYGEFHPENPATMPHDFNHFANQANSVPINAAFVYNFALKPGIRNSRIGPNLIANGIQILLDNHCHYLVGASRCPSFSGSALDTTSIREAIQRYPENPLPWELDPVLSFYSRALACTFTRPLANFLPEDKESGGYAIGFYKQISGSTRN